MARKIPFVNIALFAATFLTTLVAGSYQSGVDPIAQPGRIMAGLPFALTLMLILVSHELSHYMASRAHHTAASLPYFIPAPSLIGTFGAFIKMKSPIMTRKALVDIGASGPIVGFVISVAASVIGLSHSKVVAVSGQPHTLSLGDSILFIGLSKLVLKVPPEGHDVLLHPVAFAGWIGLFVTSLNLLPIGQLDGGHIAYALLGRLHRYVSTGLVIALALMGLFFWVGWTVWAVLMLILGLRHPPVQRWESRLDPERKFVGVLALVIFVVTFMPVPFSL
jgi:membrane-associated protease RseP (regulator of RpoE activity)